MTFRLSLLLLLLASAPCLPMAHATQRAGDATYLYELKRYARAVTGLEKEFLSLIDAASGEERFDLYWTYNHLTGAWVQVDFLQTDQCRSPFVALGSRNDRQSFVGRSMCAHAMCSRLLTPPFERCATLRQRGLIYALLTASTFGWRWPH